MKYLVTILILAITINLGTTNFAEDAFASGPVIEDFGKSVIVNSDTTLDSNHKFNVAFDLGKQGPEDAPNRGMDSLARFINMHAKAGLKPENINLALVVHGKAAYDLLSNEKYEDKFLVNNPNAGLMTELLNNQVTIYLCGQTAAYYGIKNEDLHAGVKMALSAMTAHALLQQQGYTLNPF